MNHGDEEMSELKTCTDIHSHRAPNGELTTTAVGLVTIKPFPPRFLNASKRFSSHSNILSIS